jgi:hypothetical protein
VWCWSDVALVMIYGLKSRGLGHQVRSTSNKKLSPTLTANPNKTTSKRPQDDACIREHLAVLSS